MWDTQGIQDPISMLLDKFLLSDSILAVLGYFIAQRKLHRPVHRQSREMNVVLSIEHDLLSIFLCRIGVHATVPRFSFNLVKGASVVG